MGTTTTGLLINQTNIIDAINYIGSASTPAPQTAFRNSMAPRCNTPDQVIMETPYFKRGELFGNQKLEIVSAMPMGAGYGNFMVLEIWKRVPGETAGVKGYQKSIYTSAGLDSDSFLVFCAFDASYEYKFIIKGSSFLSATGYIDLDYIRITPISENEIGVSSIYYYPDIYMGVSYLMNIKNEISDLNPMWGTMYVTESAQFTITGNGTRATTNVALPLRHRYSQLRAVCQTATSFLNTVYSSSVTPAGSPTTIYVDANHIDGTAWSNSLLVDVLVQGFVNLTTI